ncbi:RNA 2'-phosphotransferase [Croceimicrobium sp.]|uniref:RNA 2'-phosphotransferase n=1 Tax=Croceimicrobium sp. TaxID=2828340 RepID=UPI003BAA5080
MSHKGIQQSKLLSLVLRHKPEAIGLKLDPNGWAEVDELLQKLADYKSPMTIENLKSLVANSDKKQFVFSSDESKIRANQGHSIKVDLGLKAKVPPDVLYHGTALRNLESIKAQGLLKGNRHHVHLSADRDTARVVGQRYGKPIVLKVKAAEMHKAGFEFYCSENGVWLCDAVPTQYIVEA